MNDRSYAAIAVVVFSCLIVYGTAYYFNILNFYDHVEGLWYYDPRLYSGAAAAAFIFNRKKKILNKKRMR